MVNQRMMYAYGLAWGTQEISVADRITLRGMGVEWDGTSNG